MAEETLLVQAEAEKMEETAEPSTSTEQAEGSNDVDDDAKKLMGAGSRHMVMKDVRSAVNAFQEASSLLGKKYGETADQCADAFFSYGMALLELARMENGVLGNALEGMPEDESEDGEKEEDPNIPSAANLDEKEREQLREQVYDAMAEQEKQEKPVAEESKADGKTENGDVHMEEDKPSEEKDTKETTNGETPASNAEKVNGTESTTVPEEKGASEAVEKSDAVTEEKGSSEAVEKSDAVTEEKGSSEAVEKSDAVTEEKGASDSVEKSGGDSEEKSNAVTEEKGAGETPVEEKGVGETPAEEKGEAVTEEKGADEVLSEKNTDDSKSEEMEITEKVAKAEATEKAVEKIEELCKPSAQEKDSSKTPAISEPPSEDPVVSKPPAEETEGAKPPAEETASKEQTNGKVAEAEGEQEPEPMEGEEEGGAESEDGEENEGDENEGTEEKETDEDDVGNLQLAWEMLDLSKVIFKRQQNKEAQLKAAQAHLKLGEVSVESENYGQAIEDFLACLNIQKEHLEEHDRLLAETHYQLGLAYQYSSKHDSAISHFTQSTEVIEKRVVVLTEQLEKAAGETTEELQKEMDELKGLLPDIREKIEDSKEAHKSADSAEKALKETLVGGSSSGFSQENGSTSTASAAPEKSGESTAQVTNCVSDISHLVRKKRKPEESPVKEAKKSKGEPVENGSGNGEVAVSTNETVEKTEAEKQTQKETPMETTAVESTA